MYQLVFYVPKEHAETVKNAVFAAGCGRYKNYDQCSFESEGVGQFRPLDGSNPFLGTRNQLETVVELKVEMIVEDAHLDAVIESLVRAHPYEEPAYSFFSINKK